MLKITKITAAQAKSYYAQDDHYYAQSETLSEWMGEFAEELNLKGRVEANDFAAMLEGNLPNGAKLPGKGKDPANRRAGFDATFSAPKSVSIAALLQDDRLIQLHRQAVKMALQVAESRYAQDREWNRETKTVEVKQTGKFAIALFDHDTSRDLDPNLHTHAVILNGTQDQYGNYRSLYTDELYANRKLLDAVYLNELAYGARQLGYEIEPTVDGFELVGYNQELRDTFSQRRKAIENYVAQQVESGVVATGRQYQQAALKTRTRKREVDRDSLLKDWAAMLEGRKLALPVVPSVAEAQDFAFSGQRQAIVAARDGIDHAQERESVFKRGKVERFALAHHWGLHSWQQLQTEIAKTGALIPVEATRDRYTTQTAIDRERETIALMRRGQGKVQPIADLDRVNAIAPDMLTAGQRTALELSVTTTDQTIAWQGVAGAGKSYALNLYRQLATEAGYTVRGFAPSAAAATVLSEEAGIPSETVASLLTAKREPERAGLPVPEVAHAPSEIWVVDEAGLLSAKDAYALLKRATTQNARLLLVGDTKQLSAVEAGNPFKSLQQHGIAIAHLEESRRQKTEYLKAAVEAISQGDLGSGFHHLDQAGSIRAVETPEARVAQIVADYLALSPNQRSRTLIVANTNAERRSITAGIRAGLQAEGKLAADTFTMTSLKPHDWTTVEAKYAQRYACGDVIVPTQDYRQQQLVKGQQYAVVAVHEVENRLTLETIEGQRWEIDPSRCDRKTVYRTESIPLAPGDRMRWTRNDLAQGRRNGQEFTIVGLDERGQAIVRNQDDKTAFIDLSGRQFADSALVSTTYAAQGKTADRVFAALDGTTAKESFYVATSRARHELVLYTTDAAELQQLAARSRANENASDYVNLFTYENRHAPNQTRTRETAPRRSDIPPSDDRADRGVRVGSRAGERLAATLQGDRRVETNSSDLDRSLDALSRSLAVTRIDPDAIAHDLAAVVERRTLCRGGAAITDAFESIARSLDQIERHCRALAECDAAPESRAGILDEPDWQRDLGIESQPDSAAVTTVDLPPPKPPITLAMAIDLTPEDWLKLTPRQQLTLVDAARQHQATEPRGYAQAEQWVGQRTQLQQRLNAAKADEALARATLKDIQDRGARSFLNPFGATPRQESEAGIELSTAQAVRQRLEAEIQGIDDRHAQRQQQDAARQAWRRMPQTQGAQQILALIEQPELKAQFQALERRAQQLQEWCDLAQASTRLTTLRAEAIQAITAAYLDGQGLPVPMQRVMQQDLARFEEQHQREGRGGLSL